MSKCKLFASFLLVSSLFYSCKSETETGVMTFKVPSSHVSWGDKIVFDECVALNGKDSVILSTISKCLVDDNQIIIHDRKNRKIFAYSKEGEFKHRIGREGRAKSEYINIRDISFSQDHTLLYVLDDLGIIIYDAITGDFKGREKIELPDFVSYCKFTVLGAGHYLLFNPQEDGLGEIIEYNNGNWKDVRKSGFYQLVCERFYSFGNDIRVIPSYGEFNICTFNDGHLAPCFNIEFDGDVLPAELKPTSFANFRKASDDGRWFTCILDACETSSWVYANVVGPKETCYWIFGNKETGDVISGPTSDEDYIHVVGSDNKSFYAIVYPEYLGQNSRIWNIIKDVDGSSDDLFFITFHIKE